MLNYRLLKKLLFASIVTGYAVTAAAVDVMKWADTGSFNTPQEQYKYKVVLAALEKTVPTYGPFKAENIHLEAMSTQRAREVLRSGESINAYTAVTSKEWEEDTIPIRICIRRGLLSYRLLLVHKDNLNMFSQINTVAELMKIKVGAKHDWATTSILAAEGFNLVRGKKTDGMFYMLNGNRFDYLPRGLNEAWDDLEKYKNILNITLEPRLALYSPTPTYVFIAPNEKRLAQRINDGLEIMVKDGTLKAMFYDAYRKDIAQADLKNRKVLMVKNSSLSPKTPLDRPELWYDPNESPL